MLSALTHDTKCNCSARHPTGTSRHSSRIQRESGGTNSLQPTEKTEIQNAISEAQKARSKRTQITQNLVLQEFAKIGFSDIRKRSGFCNQYAREAATFVILHRPRKVSLRWSF
ncbi:MULTISPECIES: terminase small subunit [Acetobacter]|uniref:terminase small subunit n=1 Tax=Acetobacter TaxID=434 RepID=UPI001930EA9C